MKLDGIIVALITPLRSDESLDEPGLARLVEHVVTGGVSGIFLLGSSGEGAALPDSVKERLVHLVSQQCKGRAAVLVGAFAVGTRQTITVAERLLKQGGDIVVIPAPYYFAHPQSELADHITTVARAVSAPLMFYNIPQMAKTIIAPETAARIAQTPEVIGIKDSWGDMTLFQRELECKSSRPDWQVFQGAESVLALSIVRGANGGVVGLANVAPKLCCDLYAAAKSGDLARAWQLQERMTTLGKLHAHAQWLPCLKTAVSQLGICESHTAAPFAAPSAEAIAAIRRDMQIAGVLE